VRRSDYTVVLTDILHVVVLNQLHYVSHAYNRKKYINYGGKIVGTSYFNVLTRIYANKLNYHTFLKMPVFFELHILGWKLSMYCQDRQPYPSTNINRVNV